MSHNLFDDLGNIDISKKYKKVTSEFEKSFRIEEFELEINILDEDVKNTAWAEYVISFYDKRLEENKDILKFIGNLDKFHAMKIHAEDLLNREREKAEIERRKAELDAIEHAKFLKAQNIMIAMEIDEEIIRLGLAERNKLWCEKIESLYAKIDAQPSEVMALVSKVDQLEKLWAEVKFVLSAVIIDESTIALENQVIDKDWCEEVTKLFAKVDESFIKYMKRFDLLNSLNTKAHEAIKQLEEEQAREIERQKLLEEQERLREEQEKAELERLAELNDKVWQEFKTKMIKALEDANLKYEIENRKFYVVGVEDESKEQKELIIPEGVYGVKERAFKYNRKIETVVFPNSLMELGESLFFDCTTVKKIVMPSSIKVLPERVFCRCISLREFSAEGVEKVESGAFSSCHKLLKVNLPNATRIEGSAFHDCIRLKEIYAARKVTGITLYMFQGCKHLSKGTRARLGIYGKIPKLF